MRYRTIFALLTTLTMEALFLPHPQADDGTVTVKIREAIAFKKGTDNLFDEQQDFYVCRSIDSNTPLPGTAISNKDHATWSPPDEVSKLVPGKNQRYFDIYFELWDSDTCATCTGENWFDISPQKGPGPTLISGHYVPCRYAGVPTGDFPHVQYDVCTGQMEVKGVNGSAVIPLAGSNRASLNGVNTSSGTPDNWAELRYEVERQPANWLPDDIGINDIQIVQSVYHASKAVADKDTSLIVWIASTYPLPLDAKVLGRLTDGITTVNDQKLVTFPPGTPQNPSITLVSLFDGVNAPPFRPYKPPVIPSPNQGVVNGWARVDVFESISPNAPPQLQDCANLNNEANATTLPLMKTNDLFTVYHPFDYALDQNFITSQQLQAMYDREERYRLASWPLPSLNSTKNFNQLSSLHGHHFFFCPFEPFCTILEENTVAALAGIDRLVLSVRSGWFGQNLYHHQFVPQTSNGYSLGSFAPRAVLAEDGRFGVAVHELGHTYNLSQHSCSNPGFLKGCSDEYAFQNPPDTNPFEAEGFDVRAGAVPSEAIYPNGIYLTPNQWTNFQCPHAPFPSSRDICAANFMDSTPTSGYQNWIDTFTFHYLMENTLPHIDPFVVNLTGLIRLPNGEGDGTSAPVVEGILPFFGYQFMGTQDFTDAPLSSMGETFSGLGPFRIRLMTPSGVRDYRFNPRFFDDPNRPDLIGGFSINLPWDASTTEIQLIGPTDLRDRSCWNTLCPGDGVVLDGRSVSLSPPRASDLRAGRDMPAPPPAPGTAPAAPTIGPGHEAVVSWEASDADSPELRASLILVMQGDVGGAPQPPMPVAMEISGNTFTIPHARMADAPGTYAGRLLVSDGVNTTELFQGPLFTICNLNNGGVEVCNGIDDDCDGIVDNPLSCDDGDACTQNDHCVQNPFGGTTCQGDPVDCDDNDPCTSDTCVTTTGCSHSPKNCDDLDACTVDSCQPQACVVPDNGGGTADLPTQCPYNAQDRLSIVQADGTILYIDDVQLRSFTCPPSPGPAVCTFPPPVPGSDCSQPGGTLAGEQACADAVLTLRFTHFNPMTSAVYSRSIDLPVSFEMHAAPRTPYDLVQSFNTDLFRLFGQISGDLDFDLLRVTAGTDFSLPSPGHTTLTQAGGDWGVDSFFDISLRMDIVVAQGSQLPGLNGSQPWTVRFRTGGGCMHVPVNCDDGDPCTTDSCDPATGVCKFVPAPGAPCDDGDLCTQDDRCVQNTAGGITCQGAPVNCDDNDPCTADRCNPVTGACEHLPVVCDDGNQCTAGSCDPATGACKFVPTPGAPCNDGDACTQDDRCVTNAAGAIACQGAPVNCDDQDPCTLDRCNPVTGLCEYAPVNCDDGNPCTTDRCNPVTGACEHLPVVCDDGNQCTADSCDPANGQCAHGTVNCDDNNACTLDTCDPQSGCVHQPVPPAGEPSPARFDSQTTMIWPASPNATHWNTYRGTIPGGLLGSRLPGPVYDQACFESADAFGDGATVATDAANPPLGAAFYYLMSGEGPCGESDLGHASSGATIPNASACPTPP